MSRTSRLAGVRFKRQTYLRWWQVRPVDFALFLFPLIVQPALVLPLWIMAMIHTDDGTDISRALDATYAGLHAPKALFKIILFGWVLLIIAAVSAFLEKCYGWKKTAFVFIALAGLMASMSVNTMTLYEPYLAARN